MKQTKLALQLEYERQLDKLKEDNNSLKKRCDYVNSELKVANNRNKFLFANRENIVAEKLSRMKSTGDATAILELSDWHVEEYIDPKVINGLNEYTLDIAKQRAHNMFRRALMFIDVARGFSKIDTLVVAALGDFQSGYIHPELEEENQLSPIEASHFWAQLLVDGLTFLSKEGGFKNIIVPTCYGNHGRVQMKKRCSSGYANSYEWGMYKTLEQYCKIPKVTWKVENGYFNWLNVQGFDVRFHHGDNLQYMGGVGGITIPVNKAIAQWNKTKVADYDYFGHFHTSINMNKWTCNGSLIGYSPYGLSIKAEYEEPSQTLSIISKKRGKILTDRIYCD